MDSTFESIFDVLKSCIRHCEGRFDLLHQRQVLLAFINEVADGFIQLTQAHLGEKEGVEVRTEQFLVEQIQFWSHHRTSYQTWLILEVVAVVVGIRGAIREKQDRLSQPPSTSTPLGIVGWIRREIGR